MAITVDWPTGVISVPLADLTFVSGTLYKCDTNWLRLQLKDLEESPQGMAWPRITDHNTEYTIVGTTYYRGIVIINGYSIQFTPDVQSSVILEGSNNNFWDVENGILIQNQVQVIPTNTAGGQTIVSGSGVTAQDKQDIISGVWNADTSLHLIAGSFGEFVQKKLLTIRRFFGWAVGK